MYAELSLKVSTVQLSSHTLCTCHYPDFCAGTSCPQWTNGVLLRVGNDEGPPQVLFKGGSQQGLVMGWI